MDNNEMNISKTGGESKEPKNKKTKKLRSQFALKKGGYSIAIIALVLAVLILFNWLLSVLGERFHLEFDMTPDKINSMSKENVEYVKNIDSKIKITVCAAEYSYVNYMSQLVQDIGIVDSDDYFEQTLTLLNNYKNYSKNLELEFVDPYDMEFRAVAEKYQNEITFYGDIIVSAEESDRHKVVTFENVYDYDSQYAYYGMETQITGNNLESALTSAIAYCSAERIAKVGIYTGHAEKDYSSYYTKLLDRYGYECETIGSKLITEIPEEYDLAVIMSPTADFDGAELDAFSRFLENDGKLSKGLIYIPDQSLTKLPNLEKFLSQWGIDVDHSFVVDLSTLENSYYQYGDYSVLYSEPAEHSDDDDFDDSAFSGIKSCITSNNLPLEIGKPSEAGIKVNGVIACPETAIVADTDENGELTHSEVGEKQCYSVIESKKSDYNSDNELMTSYVYAFSSIDFIAQYAEMQGYSNKEVALACSERAAGVKSTGLDFLTKSITRDTFVTNAKSVKRIKIIYEWVIPLLIVAVSVFVYIRRRNA
ncbi:MAG: GldG family protein [Clostridia bacterium]|nr:GldG family protein [Clostridia bacterium]